MIVQKLPQQEQGFTLLEVLVSLLVTSMFFTVTIQAIFMAAIFKARAEQYDEAITWIQEDLEFVKYQASEYEKNAFPYSSRCNAMSPADGIAAGFLNDPTTGIGGNHKKNGPRILGGIPFILTRTAIYATSYNPYKIVQITYRVTSQNSGYAIVNLDTEVLPNAALKCP